MTNKAKETRKRIKFWFFLLRFWLNSIPSFVVAVLLIFFQLICSKGPSLFYLCLYLFNHLKLKSTCCLSPASILSCSFLLCTIHFDLRFSKRNKVCFSVTSLLLCVRERDPLAVDLWYLFKVVVFFFFLSFIQGRCLRISFEEGDRSLLPFFCNSNVSVTGNRRCLPIYQSPNLYQSRCLCYHAVLYSEAFQHLQGLSLT